MDWARELRRATLVGMVGLFLVLLVVGLLMAPQTWLGLAVAVICLGGLYLCYRQLRWLGRQDGPPRSGPLP